MSNNQNELNKQSFTAPAKDDTNEKQSSQSAVSTLVSNVCFFIVYGSFQFSVMFIFKEKLIYSHTPLLLDVLHVLLLLHVLHVLLCRVTETKQAPCLHCES
jgi:hypothetical protein